MFFYKNCRCPVCSGVFSDDDDIVACPVCGTPHHRDCWQKEGHCHYTDKHAEGFVWKREETVTPPPPIEDEWDEEDDEDFDEDVVRDTPPQDEDRPPRRCRRCGFANPPYADFCSRCGMVFLKCNSAGRKLLQKYVVETEKRGFGCVVWNQICFLQYNIVVP